MVASEGIPPLLALEEQEASFVRTHAKAIVACDFFVAVTATFRMIYVLVIMSDKQVFVRQSCGAQLKGMLADERVQAIIRKMGLLPYPL